MGKQLTFADRRRRDGKKRKRAGRKPSARPVVAHAKRPEHSQWNPLHLTVRALPAPWSLRSQVLFAALEQALAMTRRPDFRIVEHSVQSNHLHLVGEAESADALARGMKSFLVRATRLLNRALGRARGSIWQGRYHRSDLTTPRQVRNALVYVLNNGRKHGVVPARELVLDACSSARWFSGWSIPRSVREGPSPLEPARTALLRYLWERHGKIHPLEMPHGAIVAKRKPRASVWA